MISLGVTNFDATVTVQVITRGADTYSATGRAVKGVETAPEDIQADVQPPSGKMLEDLPEGVREEISFAVWTPYDLQTDHVVLRDGERYRVYKIWPRREDGFTKAAIGILKS